MSLRLLLVAVLAFAALPAVTASAVTQQIKVISVTVSTVSHDVGPKGASKGDTIAYRDKLVNAAQQFGKKKGAAVGSGSKRVPNTYRLVRPSGPVA